ncbi:hypothetical protein HGT73_04580 [Rosenbergiella australiborealis]|uniref:Uncharacterized protein n=1 Tax=Rosenbergiella australiborealis TaxID=1544696 RepID=A0ABS5T2T5_9GAMM|nr:YdiH family protein [Rosenbergiella australiborealis]MBT0726665.1 hypothetical protein [Rosenbergiella australiborealis]
MFSTQRFTSKELAIAYVTQQQKNFSPEQFLIAVERAEHEFVQLLNGSYPSSSINQMFEA